MIYVWRCTLSVKRETHLFGQVHHHSVCVSCFKGTTTYKVSRWWTLIGACPFFFAIIFKTLENFSSTQSRVHINKCDCNLGIQLRYIFFGHDVKFDSNQKCTKIISIRVNEPVSREKD